MPSFSFLSAVVLAVGVSLSVSEEFYVIYKLKENHYDLSENGKYYTRILYYWYKQKNSASRTLVLYQIS